MIKKLSLFLVIVSQMGSATSQIISEKLNTVASKSFIINGINCHWLYEVKLNDGENEKLELVDLISQKLINESTSEPILDLDLSLYPYLRPRNIFDLRNNIYTNQDFDINFDGYIDYQFYDQVQGGANHEYFIYLFNPKSNKFEFSNTLTGSSMDEVGIKLDKDKRVAYYSGKNGGGLYGFRRVHFNLDGTINYEERFWNEDFKDEPNNYKYAFYYLKKKDGKTIDSIRVEKKLKNEGLESIYIPFFEWIQTFD